MKKIISLFAVVMLLASCSADNTEKPTAKPNILVVGNSIVLYPEQDNMGGILTTEWLQLHPTGIFMEFSKRGLPTIILND